MSTWKHKTVHLTEDSIQQIETIRKHLDGSKSDSYVIRYAIRAAWVLIATSHMKPIGGKNVPDSELG